MQDINTQLLEAAEDGDLIKVQDAHSKGAAIENTDDLNMTALTWAAAGGHTDIVRWLLTCEPRPNLHHISYSHGTALTAAIHAKSEACYTALLTEEGSLNLKAHPHPGAFLWAVATNNLAIADAFLNAGANPNGFNLGGQLSPPVRDGEASELLADEIPFSSLGSYNIFDLPLNRAVANGLPDMVSLLLEWGADPNLKGNAKRTAFDMLAYSKNRAAVEPLLTAWKEEKAAAGARPVSAASLAPAPPTPAPAPPTATAESPAVSLGATTVESFTELLLDCCLEWLEDHPCKVQLTRLIVNAENLSLAEIVYHVEAMEGTDVDEDKKPLVFLACCAHPEFWDDPLAETFRQDSIEKYQDLDTASPGAGSGSKLDMIKMLANQCICTHSTITKFDPAAIEKDPEFDALRAGFATESPDVSLDTFGQVDECLDALDKASKAESLLNDVAYKTPGGKPRDQKKIKLVLRTLNHRDETGLPWSEMPKWAVSRACAYYYDTQWTKLGIRGKLLAEYNRSLASTTSGVSTKP